MGRFQKKPNFSLLPLSFFPAQRTAGSHWSGEKTLFLRVYMFRTCININQRPWDWETALLNRVHYSKAGTELANFLTTTACSLRALTLSCVITPKHLCASPRGSDSQRYSSFKHHQHLTYRSKPKPNQQSHANCSSRGFISFHRKSEKKRKNSTCFRFKYSLVFTKISTTLPSQQATNLHWALNFVNSSLYEA